MALDAWFSGSFAPRRPYTVPAYSLCSPYVGPMIVVLWGGGVCLLQITRELRDSSPRPSRMVIATPARKVREAKRENLWNRLDKEIRIRD